MQNFDDYSKTVPKGKLTLASLLGKATSTDAAPETTEAGEEAAEEEHYEDGEWAGEDGEYYEGEEGEYYEECYEEGEAELLPEVASTPPTRARSLP